MIVIRFVEIPLVSTPAVVVQSIYLQQTECHAKVNLRLQDFRIFFLTPQ